MMSEYVAGFFIVPVNHMEDLHCLEAEANEALDEMRDDTFYRRNQVFSRAQAVAAGWACKEGEDYENAYLFVRRWLHTHFLESESRQVIDPDELATIMASLKSVRADDVVTWAKANVERYGKVDPARLIELFDALAELVRSAPPGRYGLVCAHFREQYREPPGPPEPIPERPPMSPEDAKKVDELFKRVIARQRARRMWDDWFEYHEDGRAILGLVAPGRVAALNQAYDWAQAPFSENKYVLAHARLKEFVHEGELDEALILDTDGAVRALDYLDSTADVEGEGHIHGIATPERARQIEHQLDALEASHGGSDGLIESIWELEPHWSRDLVRAAHDQLRGVLARAIERGQGFVWLRDRYGAGTT